MQAITKDTLPWEDTSNGKKLWYENGNRVGFTILESGPEFVLLGGVGAGVFKGWFRTLDLVEVMTLESGKTYREIGKQLGISYWMVCERVKEFHLQDHA